MPSLKEFYQYKKFLFTKKNSFSKNLLKKRIRKLKKYNIPRQLKPKKILSTCPAGILYLRSSSTNTFVSLTTLKGKVIALKSCGGLGFQGKKKRSTKLAIETTIYNVAQKIKELRWKKIILFLKGFSKGRFYVLSCIKNLNVKVFCIKDITPVPHNGCRQKKLRRG